MALPCFHGVVGREDPDLLLLERALSGDSAAREAFAAAMIAHLHRGVARWFAIYGVKGRIQRDADDVVQIAVSSLFAKDAHKLREYRAEKGLSVRGWVDLIGRRALLSVLRSRQEKTKGHEVEDEAIVDAARSLEPAVDEAVNAERQLALLRARLDKEDRFLLELRLDQLTNAEIAEVLDCSVEAVESQIARWKKRVRAILGKGDGSGRRRE